MGKLGEFFIELRTDSSKIKADTDKGVLEAGQGPAPKLAGDAAGKSFSSSMTSRIEDGTRRSAPRFVASYAATGGRSGKAFGDRFTSALRPMKDALDKLSLRTVSPKVELRGMTGTMADFDRIDERARRIDGRTLTMHVRIRQSLTSRLLGGGGGGGIGGLLGGIGGAAGSGGGGAASGLSGLASGGLSSPLGAGAAGAGIATALSLVPAAVGLGLGGGVGAAGIGLSALIAKQAAATIKLDQAQVKAAKSGPQLARANRQLAADMKANSPFISLVADVKQLAAPLQTALTPFVRGLIPIIKTLGAGLTKLAPQFTKLFVASLPFLRQFAQLMLTSGKILIPVFTQALNQMVKSGALRIMTQALVVLVQGLAGFITALGPGMKDSAQIFLFLAKVTAVALIGLGQICTTLAHKAVILGQEFAGAWHVISRAWSGAVSFFASRARAWAAAWGTTVADVRRAWSTTVNALHDAWQRTTAFFRSAAAGAWSAIKSGVRSVWNVISSVFGFIVNGAAKAFGWVPGLGGKLKSAANAFDQFRDRVNKALGGVNGRHVNVNVGFSTSSSGASSLPHGRARGGPIYGPGTGTSDTAGMFALSDNEYVMRAASHSRYGTAAMDAVNEGRAVIGYAAGGAVGLGVGGKFPTQKSINASIDKSIKAAAAEWYSAFAGSGPIGGGSYGVARWAPVILAALRMLGQSPAWLSTVERRMNQESGGDPTIVNKWDSNWLAGHPSVGLMQVIAGTYAAYSGPFRNIGPFEYGVSVSPLANIYSGLNYALHAYGSLGALNRPGGYGNGGTIGEDMLAVGKSGRNYLMHRGEEITPTRTVEQQMALMREEIRVLKHIAGLLADNPKAFAAALNGATRRAVSR